MTGPRTIRAAVLHEPGTPLRVEEVVLAPPGPGEVLVRVAAAGVCHTDVLLADGELGAGRVPIVPGHEGAGVVEEAGPGVTTPAVGDPVAFCFVPACGACPACLGGRRAQCAAAAEAAWAGTLLDGTSRLSSPGGEAIQHFNFVSCFAERAVVPVGAAVPIPTGLPWREAALLGCAVVTGTGAVRNAARVAPGESVCVVGCGGVGLQIVSAARRAGASPIVAVDVDEAKLALATSMGATHVVLTGGPEAVAEVRSIVTDGVHHAFEAAGRPQTMRTAFDVLRPGGTAIVVGIAPWGAEVSLPARAFLSETAIRGSYYGSGDPARDLAELATLAAAGGLQLDRVVSEVTDLDGLEMAFDRLRSGEGVRTVAAVDPSIPVPA